MAPIFDGEKEAKLIALACSKPPKGRARWTLRLLENKVVELGIVDRASDTTIHRTLKKMSQTASESELGVLSAQCLDRRIPDQQTLIDEIAAWEHDRNIDHTKSD